MKFYFLLLISVFPMLNVLAHTCHPEKIKCPIDGNKVEFCVTMSMSVFGNTMDFQKQGAIGSYYEESINSCKKCNFSGYYEDFEKEYTTEEKQSIINVISKYKGKKLNEYQECNVAAEIKIALNETNNEIANCYLVGSYMARDYNADENERYHFQEKAIQYFEKGIDKNEFKEDLNYEATINYLIGELYRRIGKFSEAIKYFDLAITAQNKEDWLEEITLKQKEMALSNDSNNKI